jgi:tetratricopeptide (TPR) repeat protein
MRSWRRTLPALWAAATVIAVAVGARRAAGPIALAIRRDRADRLYRAHAWHQADTAFAALVSDAIKERRTGPLPVLAYNSGNAAYRLGRFEEAERRFQGGLAGPRVVQARSYFNLGNSYVWQARAEYDRVGKRSALRAAIGSYEEALLLDPHDVDAKWNLEIALLRLTDAEEPAGGGLHRGEADWGGGNLTKAGYAGAPQTGAGAAPGGGFGTPGGEDAVQQITATQARQLLKAVEHAAVTGQQLGPAGRPGPRPPSHQRDW